jgi:hypothetical protein
MAPGAASISMARQWTFPNRQWAAPDMTPVPILATWIVADATAGTNLMPASRVAEVTP